MSFPLRIHFGIVNAYLVPVEAGYALIDTGDPGLTFLLFQALDRHKISLDQLKLIILTHIHYDHIGGLWAVQARSGAPVMVHQAEAADLAAGRVVIPPGVYPSTRLLSRLGRWLSRFCRFPGYQAEHVVSEEEMPLHDFGLNGSVLHTPGHSPGSISILLDNGDAFVGDLCPNLFPRKLWSHFPPYAYDIATVYESWDKLLSRPIKLLYPGHGAPYKVEELRRDRNRKGSFGTQGLTPS
jgi:glyoxylase-like metal-dependent hydrolase (beta-lactamase superfamily II)